MRRSPTVVTVLVGLAIFVSFVAIVLSTQFDHRPSYTNHEYVTHIPPHHVMNNKTTETTRVNSSNRSNGSINDMGSEQGNLIVSTTINTEKKEVMKTSSTQQILVANVQKGKNSNHTDDNDFATDVDVPAVVVDKKSKKSHKISLTNLPRPHPHAGARFSNGTWGYKADVTLARKWFLARYHQARQHDMRDKFYAKEIERNVTKIDVYDTNILPPMSYLPIEQGKEMEKVCNAKPREGSEKKAGWRLLTRKVQVNNFTLPSSPSSFSKQATTRTTTTTTTITDAATRKVATKQNGKILCAVYTYEKNHYKIPALIETWGWRCDGLLIASTATVEDPFVSGGIVAIDIPHEGPEMYDNMWMKSRSIWSYIHDNYVQQKNNDGDDDDSHDEQQNYDFFYLSGDDTHVIVENLRHFLSSLGHYAIDWPLYLGHWIPDKDHGYFCGGGPGYVLNRKSVQILVNDLLPTCNEREMTSAEDRLVGECFRRVGIIGNTSVDESGAQRFHGMDPHFVSSYNEKGNKLYMNKLYEYWGKLHGYKTGANLTSSDSISFHLLKYPRWMKRHHAILYKSCQRGTILGDILV